VNIPLLFVVSIVSDADLLIPGLRHRGPTHSLVVFLLFSIPLFILYGKRVLPYFTALAQHSFIGDYLMGGGVQILWPLSPHWYHLRIAMASIVSILAEWILFLLFLITLLRTKDAQTLFRVHSSNLLLFIPVFTVLLPSLFNFPLLVPSELLIPHMMYLGMFIASILIDLLYILRQAYLRNQTTKDHI